MNSADSTAEAVTVMWRHLRSAVSIRLQPIRECSAIKSEIGHPLSVICCINLHLALEKSGLGCTRRSAGRSSV